LDRKQKKKERVVVENKLNELQCPLTCLLRCQI